MMEWRKRDESVSTLEGFFLKNMNVETLNDVNEWFKKSYSNAYTINDLDVAVDLALKFRTKTVKIVGDYDVDGETSVSILMKAFEWAGFKNVSYRIPYRFTEGFGINPIIIDEINQETDNPGDTLIITCDNGVAQTDTIKTKTR